MPDASCRLLCVFFDALAEDGIPPEALVRGTSVPLEVARDERQWIGWEDLSALSARASALVGGDQILFAKAVRLLERSSGHRTILRVLSSLASPKLLYRGLTGWITGQLFVPLSTSYEDLGPNRVGVEARCAPGYPWFPQLETMLRATLAALPTVIGLPVAEVSSRQSPRGLHFEVRVQASRNLWARLRRAWMALFSSDAVVAELDVQARVLAARNQELSSAREAAERASALKSQFLMLVHHELRTPLVGMLGSMELLEGSVGPSTGRSSRPTARPRAA